MALYFYQGLSFSGLLLSLLCCALSFNMGSLLVVEGPMLLVFSLAVYKTRTKILPLIILGLLPPYFYLTARKPYGIYNSYNQVQPDWLGLVKPSFKETWRYFRDGFQYFPMPGLTAIYVGLFFLIPLLAGFYYFVRISKKEKEDTSATIKKSAIILGFAVLLSVSGMFPYLAVGKIPHPYSGDSRHALPLFCSIPFYYVGIRSLLTSLVHRINAGRYLDLLAATLITIIMFGNINNYIGWDYDNFRQQAIYASLRKHVDDFKNCDLAAFTQQPRPYAPYEWSAILADVTGSERIVVGWDVVDAKARADQLMSLKETSKFEYRGLSGWYMADEYSGGSRACNVTVSSNVTDDRSLESYVNLKINELFHIERFGDIVGGWYSSQVVHM
ncbi:MAG: hypothetical protein HQK54_09160 [Oligoflexales bacterium]|nr:hypothetical protein [Oligoflexales bacterium]